MPQRTTPPGYPGAADSARALDMGRSHRSSVLRELGDLLAAIFFLTR